MRRLLATAVALLVAAPAASAATIPVNTSSDTNVDDGLCSLREAVRAANTDAPTLGCPAGGGPDTISVPAGTFKLTIDGDDQAAANGDLDITATVTIRGQGQGVTTVDGNSISRVFEVRPAVTGVRIERMTVTGGAPERRRQRRWVPGRRPPQPGRRDDREQRHHREQDRQWVQCTRRRRRRGA